MVEPMHSMNILFAALFSKIVVFHVNENDGKPAGLTNVFLFLENERKERVKERERMTEDGHKIRIEKREHCLAK